MINGKAVPGKITGACQPAGTPMVLTEDEGSWLSGPMLDMAALEGIVAEVVGSVLAFTKGKEVFRDEVYSFLPYQGDFEDLTSDQIEAVCRRFPVRSSVGPDPEAGNRTGRTRV